MYRSVMKKVRDTDCRRLDQRTLTELRKRGVASVQQGESPELVAAALGINRTTIYDWLALYRAGGTSALEARKRGGKKRKLNGKAMNWLYQTITMKNPMQMKFEFALWTCEMVRQMVARKFGVKLSRTSVNRLLKQLGLSAQRPLWRAYQQDPQKVEHWLKTEYPRIRKLATKAGAYIYFGDHAGVRSDHHAGTTWSPRGVTSSSWTGTPHTRRARSSNGCSSRAAGCVCSCCPATVRNSIPTNWCGTA